MGMKNYHLMSSTTHIIQKRLNIDQIKERLLQLDYVRQELESWDKK